VPKNLSNNPAVFRQLLFLKTLLQLEKTDEYEVRTLYLVLLSTAAGKFPTILGDAVVFHKNVALIKE